jgi:hypothetical protein
MARNSLVLIQVSNGLPDATATVELYTGSDTSPFWTTPKIGDFSNNGDGSYYIDLTSSIKGTVLVNGAPYVPMQNHWFQGDDGAGLGPNAVKTENIEDQAVTPAKTTFAGEF